MSPLPSQENKPPGRVKEGLTIAKATDYLQEQHDEFLSLESIYQDDFERIEGRGGAWKVSGSSASRLK